MKLRISEDSELEGGELGGFTVHSMKILENFKTFLLNLILFRKRLENCGDLLNKMDYFLSGP